MKSADWFMLALVCMTIFAAEVSYLLSKAIVKRTIVSGDRYNLLGISSSNRGLTSQRWPDCGWEPMVQIREASARVAPSKHVHSRSSRRHDRRY